jgi:hypothetical protein
MYDPNAVGMAPQAGSIQQLLAQRIAQGGQPSGKGGGDPGYKGGGQRMGNTGKGGKGGGYGQQMGGKGGKGGPPQMGGGKMGGKGGRPMQQPMPPGFDPRAGQYYK